MRPKFNELYAKAQTAFGNERYDTVIKLCREAIDLDSTVPEVHALLGNAFLVTKHMAEAEYCFMDAIRLNPKNGELYFNLGNSLFGQQRLSEALENYAKAVQLGCPDEVTQKIYYLMGVINQVDRKNYKDALINFEKSERISGTNTDRVDILLKKIQIYVEQQQFEKAENDAIQLRLLVPSEFQSYQLLFQLYLQQKKMTEAKRVLDEAETNVALDSGTKIEIGFDRAMLLCFLAEQDSAQMQTHYKEALEQLNSLGQSGLLSEKDKCEVLITRAEIYMKLGQYDMAIQLATTVASYTKDELLEYIERGNYLLMSCADIKKDYLAVRRYAKKLKESQNVFYRHHGYYSEAYAVKKLCEVNQSFEKECIQLYNIAIAYYRNATVMEPGDFMAYLYRAKSYVDIGKYDKAEEIEKLLPENAQKSLHDYIQSVRLR